MEVADRIAVMNEGAIEQVGAPREIYDAPANSFVMGFLGPVSRVGDRLVRPHDMTVSLTPAEGAIEAMVARVVHLGFEVRLELQLPDGQAARAQLTRAQEAELELAAGDIVYVRPPEGGASLRSASLGPERPRPDGAPGPTDAGRSPAPNLTG
jgi:sulfate transport system ATP-binding protein